MRTGSALMEKGGEVGMRRADALFYLCEYHDPCLNEHLYDAMTIAIQELSTKLQSNGWVSVKDRLPNEATGCVLVCMPKESHSRVRTGQYSEYSKQWYIGDMCGVGGDEPIAWMPLPEPPKEVSE